MNLILVPTDFSETAAGAFRYAQHFARRVGADLDVLHVYHPGYDLSNSYVEASAAGLGEIKQQALDDFVGRHRLHENAPAPVSVHTQLVTGFAAEEIVRSALQADLVIMGTTGEGGMLEQLLGTVSSFVARQARCPVLLIPKDSSFREIRRVMYTTNHTPADEGLLRRIVREFALQPDTVHVVHADQQEETGYRVTEERYKELLQNEGPALNIHFAQINAADILEGLYQFAVEHEVDLIIMGTVHRNFLQRLFHRSFTRQMIRRTSAPLLVMHFDD